MASPANIVQLAYILNPDGMDAALDYWINVMGAGPFYRGEFPLTDQMHKGRPTGQHAVVACGYNGEMQVELIMPLNAEPGPYSDFLADKPKVPVGGLYHHVMLEEGDFDATIARLVAHGCKEAFTAKNALGERIAYLESADTTGGYIEVIESEMWPRVCKNMRAAREGWDGKDRPVRSFEEIM